MDWRIHWLEAEGDLGPWRTALAAEIEVARTAIARVLPPHCLDVIVQRVAGAVIPETGDNGFASRKGLFSLTVDPENPAFPTSLANGTIRRTVAHEVHHCLRMAAPGFGETLGDALVREGLAGRFVSHLFGSPPEIWERAVDERTLRRHRPDAKTLASTDYDHAAWFFGGGAFPRWIGYTLGYEIVGAWLAEQGDVAAETWVTVPTSDVLAGCRWLRQCPEVAAP